MTGAAVKPTPVPAAWRTGWCETGHHGRCPHQIRRPAPNPPAECACPCHTTPPEPARCPTCGQLRKDADL